MNIHLERSGGFSGLRQGSDLDTSQLSLVEGNELNRLSYNLSRHLPMPRKRTLRLHCPICKKEVKSGDPEFPFCSDRCRTIDLGKWASGSYVIPSPVGDAEEPIRERTPEDSDE